MLMQLSLERPTNGQPLLSSCYPHALWHVNPRTDAGKQSVPSSDGPMISPIDACEQERSSNKNNLLGILA